MTRLSLILVATITLCSCQHISSTQINKGDVLTLDKLSTEQLHVFLKGHTGDWRQGTPESRGIPPPPIQKPYPSNASLVDLVRPQEIRIGNMPLADAINQRRSRRAFTGEALTNEELSFLLWNTQGISKIEKDSDGKIMHHFRTVPSGGAKHPFETYLIINRVTGIKPGLYRFLPMEHKLLLLRKSDLLSLEIVNACYGQKHVGEAAVVFVWSVIPARTEWHYGCVAPKLIAVDAGHLCQNLYLAAESFGAGACAVLGYQQTRLDKLIEVDGREEFAFYLAPVGKVAAP